MASYKLLISMQILDIQASIEIYGYENQASYTKKFRELFGMTPTEAHDKKDESKILPPLTWQRISDDVEYDTMDADSSVVSKTKFGITYNQYLKIMEAR